MPALAQLDPVQAPEVVWSALVPILVLFGAALVLVTIATLTARRPPAGTWAGITLLAALGTLVSCAFLWDRVSDPERGPFTVLKGALTVDGFAVFVIVAIAASVGLTALLADDYLRREQLDGPELYALLLSSATGGVVMAMANDLIVLFLGLEILSIALYVAAAFHRRRAASREASLKYFVLGAFSSAFLLYGIAFVYGATGATTLTGIRAFVGSNVLEEEGLLLAGLAFMLVGLGFKVSAVPFHVWTPDVYQGSPTPVSGFMASASKAAAFAALLRVFVTTFGTHRLDWQPLVGALAVLTLVVGAVLAIVQDDVKRMMAYSSISHAGFILVGVQVATPEGTAAVLFYLLAYTFLIVGTFGVATVVGRRGDAAHAVDDYRGLARRRPGLALTFAVFLLAQAGVPLTTGFLAKFYVIGAAVESRSYWLAIVAMVSAVISAYLYLRIVVAMYMSEPVAADEAAPRLRVPVAGAAALAVCVAFTLVVGVLPDRVTTWADDAVPVLTSVGG